MFRSLAALTVSVILLVGCSGGGKKQEHRDGECDYSVLNPSSRPQVNPLWYHNAQFFEGKTVRWPHRLVTVAIFDPRVNCEALQMILGEINLYIFPTRLAIVQTEAIYSDIEIWPDPNLWEINRLGQCTWIVGFGYFLVKAVVELGNDADFYGCHFYAVLKHELLHAVGIFEHTTDGGVMNVPTYNDVITQNVIDVLVPLYSFPAGTSVFP